MLPRAWWLAAASIHPMTSHPPHTHTAQGGTPASAAQHTRARQQDTDPWVPVDTRQHVHVRSVVCHEGGWFPPSRAPPHATHTHHPLATTLTRYVRIKRKNQTIFLLIEPTDAVQAVKAKVGEMVNQDPRNIKFLGPEKVNYGQKSTEDHDHVGAPACIQLTHAFPFVHAQHRRGNCRTGLSWRS